MAHVYRVHLQGNPENPEFVETNHRNILEVWAEVESQGYLKGRRMVPKHPFYDNFAVGDKGDPVLIPRHAISMVSGHWEF